jgi:hypothetical protein
VLVLLLEFVLFGFGFVLRYVVFLFFSFLNKGEFKGEVGDLIMISVNCSKNNRKLTNSVQQPINSWIGQYQLFGCAFGQIVQFLTTPMR